MTPAELSRTVLSTVRRAVAARELRVAVPERVVVQRPPRPGCGDYATNVALQLAGPAGRTPRQVAEILKPWLSREPGIALVEIAGPGFLNITLNARAYGDVVRQVRAQRGEYGHSDGLFAEPEVEVEPEADTEPYSEPALDPGPGPGPDENPYPALRPRLLAEATRNLRHAAGAPDAHVTDAPAEPPHTPTTPLGPDATRWALLRPPAEDPLPAPADLARLLSQRESNPLFRLRYAHARTRALLRNAHDLGVDIEAPEDPDGTPYHHPAETELLGLIADFPRIIETAARRRAPDRLARHLERLADAYLRFQDECPALPKGDEKPSAVHASRIRLADATGIVLANGLHLLGISAPAHL
ncbi:ArgS-related anticodon-binding protein NrtL [Streptomyces sp. CA-111067]|uniref:ArgS-related anticodon-binding protein NrtL n=1 Tax=Streptomyces sp. CA-111067 TaxID=3240046 RepID=UPI003D9812CE